MSSAAITAELQEYVRAVRAYHLTDIHGKKREYVDTTTRELLDIADRIDEECERNLMVLPRDMDGVPIHIGDEMDCGEHFGIQEVEGFIHDAVAFTVCDPQPARICTCPAHMTRHYHKPTIDDDEAKRKACGIIDAMRFVRSSEYEFSDGCEYFISGPMSGIDGWNKAAFDACQARIKELSQDGACVINPASETPVEISGERPHTYYMLHTLHELVRTFYGSNTQMVKAVVLLPGWETSYGAVMEAMVAHECGIDLVLWEE